MLKATETQEEAVDLRGTEDATSDLLIDDYKDLELETIAGIREKTLWWMKHYD